MDELEEGMKYTLSNGSAGASPSLYCSVAGESSRHNRRLFLRAGGLVAASAQFLLQERMLIDRTPAGLPRLRGGLRPACPSFGESLLIRFSFRFATSDSQALHKHTRPKRPVWPRAE